MATRHSPPTPKSACHQTNAAHNGTDRSASPARGHRFSPPFLYSPLFSTPPSFLNPRKHANATLQTSRLCPPRSSSPLTCTARRLAVTLRRAPPRRCPSPRAPSPPRPAHAVATKRSNPTCPPCHVLKQPHKRVVRRASSVKLSARYTSRLRSSRHLPYRISSVTTHHRAPLPLPCPGGH